MLRPFRSANATVTEGNTGTANAIFAVTLVGGEREHGDGRLLDRRRLGASRRATTPRTSGTLTFTPGQTTKQIVVPVNGDTAVEPNETFTVELSNPANATISGTGIGTGTITNDDALPTLSIGERDRRTRATRARRTSCSR